MTTGERIKYYREANGMTQAELAAGLFVSPVVISQWETGKRNPKYTNLEKIANELGVTVSALTNPLKSFSSYDDIPEGTGKRMVQESFMYLTPQETRELADRIDLAYENDLADNNLSHNIFHDERYADIASGIIADFRKTDKARLRKLCVEYLSMMSSKGVQKVVDYVLDLFFNPANLEPLPEIDTESIHGKQSTATDPAPTP